VTLVLSLGRGEDGAGASAHAGVGVPASGRLTREQVGPVARELRALLRPAGGLAADDDLTLSAREREAGELLTSLLMDPACARVAERIARAAGVSEARGEPLVVAVDAGTAELRALPWELLEGGHGLLAGVACRVVRLVEGRQRAPAATDGLAVSAWTPTADDPLCAAAMREVRDAVGRIERATWTAVEPSRAPEPARLGVGRPGRLLYVSAHGVRGLDGVGWSVERGGVHSADAAGQLLDPWLERADLVLLDVCDAADGEGGVDAPGWRIAARGPMVLAPRQAWAASAASAFRGALIASLAEGRAPLDAVAEGRRALRGLAWPHPTGRWWCPMVITTGEPVPAASRARGRTVWLALAAATVVGAALGAGGWELAAKPDTRPGGGEDVVAAAPAAVGSGGDAQGAVSAAIPAPAGALTAADPTRAATPGGAPIVGGSTDVSPAPAGAPAATDPTGASTLGGASIVGGSANAAGLAAAGHAPAGAGAARADAGGAAAKPATGAVAGDSTEPSNRGGTPAAKPAGAAEPARPGAEQRVQLCASDAAVQLTSPERAVPVCPAVTEIMARPGTVSLSWRSLGADGAAGACRVELAPGGQRIKLWNGGGAARCEVR
jgi:hypothetical protein